MVNIRLLQRLNKNNFINLKALCRKTDLNYNSIYTKISRNIELKVDEAEKIKKYFNDNGLAILEEVHENNN